MANQFTSEYTDEIIERMITLAKVHKLPQVTKMINKEFGTDFTYSGLRTKYMREKDNWKPSVDPVEETEFRESIEIKSDGTQISDKLVEMSEQEMKDPEFMLLAHGYDPSLWEIINVKVSLWHYRDKETKNPKISYATKLAVKPKPNNEYEKLLEIIREQEPFDIEINYQPTEDKHLLEIAPTDTHFGISSFAFYGPNLARIIKKIKMRHWEEIIIPVGNDLLHVDNFRNTTSSGTNIQQVSLPGAWNDACKFYYTIINNAMEHSNNVKIIYVKGNHDESMSWAFVQNLMTKYPNLEFDDSFKEHKAHVFHDVFIGFTHGDKNRKNIGNIFNTKFRLDIAKAKVREVHIGHLHGEDSKDDFGIMVRTLPTQNLEDEWHDQNGYVGKNKRFQLFEYSTDTLESIHYV